MPARPECCAYMKQPDPVLEHPGERDPHEAARIPTLSGSDDGSITKLCSQLAQHGIDRQGLNLMPRGSPAFGSDFRFNATAGPPAFSAYMPVIVCQGTFKVLK
jgi:hypothetical protein